MLHSAALKGCLRSLNVQFSDVRNFASMELKTVVRKLEEFAPTSLAGSWDNVGLLIEPMTQKPVSKILLTNDLTEPVMDEAVDMGADMIISYHPPLFKPLKRFTSINWKERIAIRCMESRIALYSPHTSWDAVQGGINEWLLQPFGPGSSATCEKLANPGSVSFTLDIPGEQPQVVSGRELTSAYANLPETVRSAVRITKHEAHPLIGVGAGRTSNLDSPLSLEEAVSRIKKHLKLDHVRLALANQASLQTQIGSVGVCAGSGGSVLASANVDLILTGEMSHHEVLDFVHRGVNVVLTDHSNTERGYHTHIRGKLVELLENQVEIQVSATDRDPLQVV